jgi:ankyrin repeat protein
MIAASRGDVASVRVLIAAGANVHGASDRDLTPLNWAVRHSQAAAVPVLVAAGADVNASANDETLLHLAVRNGSLECLRALLRAGANPLAMAGRGFLPSEVGHGDPAVLRAARFAEKRAGLEPALAGSLQPGDGPLAQSFSRGALYERRVWRLVWRWL